MELNSVLRHTYLDYVTNYTTLETFAASHLLTVDQALEVLTLGRQLQDKHKELMKQGTV